MSSSVLPLLQVQLNRYGLPFILILGNIGNIFIVILFGRHRKNSCSMYLMWAAVINSAFITLNIPIALYTIDHGDPTIRSLAFCKIRFYLYHAWGQIARYLLVLVCIDRFAITTNNARFRVMMQPSVTRYIMVIVTIFWHIFPIHLPILVTISNGRCGPIDVYYILYYTYLLVFVCFIPTVSMIIFGFLAYRNLKRLHSRIQPIGRAAHGNRGNITIHRRDRELFTLVLAEVVVYMVTTFIYPFIILEVAVTTYMGITKSAEHLQIESFISSLGTILIYLNSAVPFYIYFTVSSAFRKEFKQVFIKRGRQAVRQTNITVGPTMAQVQS